MTVLFDNDVYDKGLEHAKNNAERLVIMSDAPANYADAVSKIAFAVSVTGADLIIADKAGGGREITVASKSGTIAVSTLNGTNDLHAALLDDTNSTILALTDETSDMSLNAGQSLTTPSFKFGFNAATQA